MSQEKANRFRQRSLEYLLLTRSDPEKVKRSERFWAAVGGLSLLVFIVGPGLYYQDLGFEKYILLGCGALAAFAVLFWQFSISANRTLRDLHDYIDFEKVKSDCNEGDSQ